MDVSKQTANEKDLLKIMGILEAEYFALRLIWQEYRELYASASDLIDLMNRVAPGFFGMVQNLMLETMILRMSRLTDKRQTGTKENLSLSQIPYAIPDDKSEHVAEIRQLIRTAVGKVDIARNWRNTRLAHIDYNHAMSRDLDEFSIGYVELQKGIDAIHTVLNRSSVIAWDRELSQEVRPAAGRATYLLRALRDGP